jgi:hypothetical protein
MELTYHLGKGFYISNKKGKKNFRKLIKTLTIDQRQELMKDKLFSYIVNKTNLKIFSKKEIRYLKLKKLNEFNKTINRVDKNVIKRRKRGPNKVKNSDNKVDMSIDNKVDMKV